VAQLGQYLIPQVFVKPDGSAIVNFSYVWKRACIKAGVPGGLVHSKNWHIDLIAEHLEARR
jgi:hypothetical protein